MALNNPYALSFDGADDSITIANDNVLNPVNSITIEAWIKPSNLNTYRVILQKQHSSVNGFSYGIRFTKNSLLFWPTSITFNHVFIEDELIHVAVTYDGNEAKTYVNGVLDNIKTRSGTIDTSTYPLVIGNWRNGQYYSGFLDEVRIWNRTLSQQEIKNNMNRRLTGDEEGLVAYYRCDEGEGTALIDSSPNGNDGTIHGASYVEGEIDLKSNYLDVVTLAPTNVTYDSMTMNGELKKVVNYPTVDCKFQYSTNPEFGKLNDINNPYALSFDGTDDYVNRINIGEDIYCVEFWVYFNKDYIGDDDRDSIFQLGNQSLVLGAWGTAVAGETMWFGNSSYVSLTTQNIQTGWHHIAINWNESYYALLLDGNVLPLSKQLATTIMTGSFTIGKSIKYPARNSNLKMDEIRLWNKVLTQEEINYYMNKYLTGNENGLIAYYHCDEGSGNTLIDATGNGNNGTINGVSYVSGEVELELTDNILGIQETSIQTVSNPYVISFDGVDDYIELPQLIPSSEDFTFQCIIDTDSLELDGALLSQGSSSNIFVLYPYTNLGGAGQQLRLYIGSSEVYVGSDISNSDLITLTLVKNVNDYFIYIDGNLDGQANSSVNINGTNTYIGKHSSQSGYYIKTNIDEIQFWDKALSQQEIQENMNKYPTGNENGLAAYYHCDEGSGTTLTDETSNNNNGTIYGATYESGQIHLPYHFSETLTGLDNTKKYYYRAIATTAGESLNNYNPYELSFNCNSYVDTPLTGGYSAYTISFRIKPSIINDHIAIIQKKSSGSDIDLWGFSFLSNKIRFLNEYASNAYATLTSTTDILAGNYYNITITADGTEGKLYIDGVLEDSLVSSHFIDAAWVNSEIIKIGAEYHEIADLYYNGIIDEIRIFDKVLSQSEIQANLNRRLVGIENDLVAYYRCDNVGHEKVLIDSSGNDNHGIIYGTTWVSKY